MNGMIRRDFGIGLIGYRERKKKGGREMNLGIHFTEYSTTYRYTAKYTAK
jgi:hypothetical protein